MSKPPIPVGISARHIHLSKEDLNTLFGEGYELTHFKPLTQPGQFASNEFISLEGEKGSFPRVRVLGPVRGQTQIEVSLTDAAKLGVKAPVKDSGDLEGSAGITVVGPKGKVTLHNGVIVARRHIHMLPEDAAQYDVKDHDFVQIRVGDASRSLIFDQVHVRVTNTSKLECHLDTDEANASLAKTGDVCTIIK
ncbi:MAG: phosphate propanoyltransferase [Firmicutes bacterium]|nr:phosphate propanoyltransferase [Bacillota bacterium]